jgi:hypothetical protein
MIIPDDLRTRLNNLGETPEAFAGILESRGPEFFVSFLRHFIEQRERVAALSREWSPRLRAYAAECRSRDADPESATLSEQDRAKLPIYAQKIQNAERIRPKDEAEVIICRMPWIAIPVAQRLWPGEDDLSVILTPEELRGWNEIYKHPEAVGLGWVNYWWDIDDRPDPNSLRYQHHDIHVADGENPWIVTSGLSWGALAGGVISELWSWNGTGANYVRSVASLTF